MSEPNEFNLNKRPVTLADGEDEVDLCSKKFRCPADVDSPKSTIELSTSYEKTKSQPARKVEIPDNFAHLLSFNQFFSRQPDNITDNEAKAKYEIYKEEFERKRLHHFFSNHHMEEWFRIKYHPKDSENPRLSEELSRKRRAELFWDHVDTIQGLRLDFDHQESVEQFMELIARKLENIDDVVQLVKGEVEDETTTNSVESTDHDHVNANRNQESFEDNPDSGIAIIDPSNCNVVEECNNNEIEFAAATAKEKSEEGCETTEGGNYFGLFGGANEKDENIPMAEIVDPEKNRNCGSAKADKLSPSPFSLNLKRVPASISRAELESWLSKYPGFMRLALSAPTAETGYKTRRAWATFSQETNVKDVCMKVAEVELAGADLGAVVSKELDRKVRVAPGPLLHHEEVVRSDIQTAARIIEKLNLEWNLDTRLLDNIQDHLVEFCSAEEDELMGVGHHEEEAPKDFFVVVNDDLTSYLDKLLVYLRLVHSIDFYNHSEYPHEDEMPNRFGLIHIRGPVPKERQERSAMEMLIMSQKRRLRTFTETPTKLTEDETMVLGWKDPDVEVEDYINSVIEVTKTQKYLCKLSGKKFKAESYVRKHIFTKFEDKLEEVENDVKCFNNYLSDPNRPQIKPTTFDPAVPPPNLRGLKYPKYRVPHRIQRYRREQRKLEGTLLSRPQMVHPRSSNEYLSELRPSRSRMDYNDLEMFRF